MKESSEPVLGLLRLRRVEWVNFTGVLLLIIAYAHGPMTLVTVAAASQPIFVIAGSAILAWLGFRSRPVSVLSRLSKDHSCPHARGDLSFSWLVLDV